LAAGIEKSKIAGSIGIKHRRRKISNLCVPAHRNQHRRLRHRNSSISKLHQYQHIGIKAPSAKESAIKESGISSENQRKYIEKSASKNSGIIRKASAPSKPHHQHHLSANWRQKAGGVSSIKSMAISISVSAA